MKIANLFCVLECKESLFIDESEIFKLDDNTFLKYEFDYDEKKRIIKIIDKKELKEIFRNFKKDDKDSLSEYKITFKQYEDINL